MAGLIVLDADVLIGHLDARDAHHQAAGSLLRSLAAEEKSLVASTVTVAEVLVRPAATGKLAAAQRALRDLGVTEVGLREGAAARLAALRSETGRRLPDCCVLLAAEDAGAGAVASFDERLVAAARERRLAVRP